MGTPYPSGVLKIYSKAKNGRTVDVEEVLIHLEEPRAIGCNTRVRVELSEGRVNIINGVGGVMYNHVVPKGVLRITWDGDVVFEAGKKMY